MKYIASNIRSRSGMSIKAQIAYSNAEMPASRWANMLGIETIQVKQLLINAGWHLTGKFARHTDFYRLPKKNDQNELTIFLKLADKIIPKSKRKFWTFIIEQFSITV